MPARKQFQTSLQPHPDLKQLLIDSRVQQVTEDVLREQRISFAYGNAMNAENITRDSVAATSQHIRLAPTEQ